MADIIQDTTGAILPLSAEQLILNQLQAVAGRIISGEIERNGVEVELYLKDLKSKHNISLKSLAVTLASLLPQASETQLLSMPVEQDDSFTGEEMRAAVELLAMPNLFPEFHKDFQLTGYQANRQLTDAGLQVLGRTLLPTSSGEYGHGKLASGKSEFYSKVAGFFPLARTLVLTTFTEKFLFYAGGVDGRALQHFLVIYGESDMADRKGDDTFKQQYLRQMLTENRIIQGSVEKNQHKRNEVTFQVLYGPITLVITGVDSPSHFDPQTVSRLYCRHFKHTHESIHKVLESKATKGAISANPKLEENAELRKAQRKWQCAFTLLTRFNPSDTSAIIGIRISFLEKLIFNKKRLTEADMRTFDRLKESITVSTLLHQKGRYIEGGILEATPEDYLNVLDSFLESVSNTQDLGRDLTDRFRQLLTWWQKPENSGRKTKAQIARALGANENTVKKWIYTWCKNDLLEEETDSDKRNAKRYYKPAQSAAELLSQIDEDESLAIEKELTLQENPRSADPKSRESSNDKGSELVTTDLIGSGLVMTSGNDMITDQELINVDHHQLRPAESPAESDIPDTKGHWSLNTSDLITEIF